MTTRMAVGHVARGTRRRLLRAASAAAIASAAATASAGAGRAAMAAQATPTAAPAPLPVETQLALEAIVDGALADTFTPGALVGVWLPGGGAWLKAAGVGDLATGAPVSLDDHVRIASITKTFVATVVLQLVDEGQLNLDDTLEGFVPGIANGDAITLRQVLGMTAGIRDYVTDPRIAIDYAADPLLPFSPEEAVQIMRRGTPNFAPGDGVQYSNSNYILLGLIVEQVTGNSIEQEIEERIITPLGLSGTSFPTSPEMPAPFMHGYAGAALGDPLVDASRSNPALPWASGAMISTLRDMRTWGEALATGSLLSPETQRQQLEFTPFPNAAPGQEVGYGLGILSFNGLLGHNGGIVGYSLWLVHDPDTGATVAVVTNRATIDGGTADPIFGGIVSLLFPERFPPAPATATPTA
jgi:D-alanyl-D-alanine carboxypeptidase